MTNSNVSTPRYWPVVFHSVATFLGQSLMQVVDLVFCRDLGSVASATIGTGTAFLAWFIILGIGLLSSLEFLIPHAYGSGESEKAEEIFRAGMGLSLLASLLSMIGLTGVARFAPAYGMNPELTDPVRQFCDLLAWSIPPILMTPVIRIELQCRGLPNTSTEALLLGNLLNVLLNWLWVQGHWGFPAMGIQGSAWANVGSRWFIVLFLFWSLSKKSFIPSLTPDRILKSLKAYASPVLKLGFPAALHMMFEVGAFILVGLLASRLDASQNAAHAIAISLASFVFMIPAGLSSAAALTMSHSLGLGHPNEAIRRGRHTLLLGLTYASVGSLVFFLLREPLVALYTTDEPTRRIGVQLILIAGFFQFGDALQVILAGCLRGLGETKTQAVMNAVGHWGLGIPLGLYLGFWKKLGVEGFWIGLCLGLFCVAALLLHRYLAFVTRLKSVNSASSPNSA
jgi:MATE family multidrug resistance protein